MESIFICVLSLLFMFIGVPIGLSFCMGMIGGVYLFDVTTIEFVAQGMYNGYNSLPVVAIPCFMLAGMVMESGGLSKRLINVANQLVGNMTGGLGSITIIACLFFGAISGSAPATVAAIGGIMIPSMVKYKYDKDYSTGLVAVAGSLGVIVPPSIPFVIYGAATDTSIGALFLAGVLPAILIAVILLVISFFISKKKGYSGTNEVFSFKELLISVKDGIWALIMPLIILGGIYGGIFTPTEAAVVALVYGIFVGVFIYKELKIKDLVKILDKHVSFTGGIIITFGPAITLGAIFSLLGVPQAITAGLLAVSANKIVALLLVNVFLLLAGMIVDSITAIVILGPMLLVALKPFGVDPIHFGVIMVLNLAVGFVTPPIAANLFVASGMTGIPIDKIIKVAMPFIIALLISLLIVTFVPGISLILL